MSKTFRSVTQAQYEAIQIGDMVVNKAGKPYQCCGFQNFDRVTGKRLPDGQKPFPRFVQIRNGKPYQADKTLLPANIALPTSEPAAAAPVAPVNAPAPVATEERITAEQAREMVYGADYAERVAQDIARLANH